MDRTEALDQLPHAHAVALRLQEGGATPETIAGALDIEPESVRLLLLVAQAKLTRIVEGDRRVPSDSDGTRAAGSP